MVMTARLSKNWFQTGPIKESYLTPSSYPVSSSPTYWIKTSEINLPICPPNFTAGIHWKRGATDSAYTSRSLVSHWMVIGLHIHQRCWSIAAKMWLYQCGFVKCLSLSLSNTKTASRRSIELRCSWHGRNEKGFPLMLRLLRYSNPN